MDIFRGAREAMVTTQLAGRGITDSRVLDAMAKVERERFVPEPLRHLAYADRPLSVGHDQTISQPFIVAYMSQALKLEPGDKVLDVGTGSGYQTAVLAELVREVHTIEIVPELAVRARAALEAIGYDNILFHVGDGHRGVPEAAPFDAILAAAAPRHIPGALVDQLRDGGRLVLPIGDHEQTLVRIERRGSRTIEEALLAVRFVPMVRGGTTETPAGG